jgi:hypothetical protein
MYSMCTTFMILVITASLTSMIHFLSYDIRCYIHETKFQYTLVIHSMHMSPRTPTCFVNNDVTRTLQYTHHYASMSAVEKLFTVSVYLIY